MNIRPGTYKLSHDVANPKPDKRKDDWRYKPIFPAGMRFVIVQSFKGETDLEIRPVNYRDPSCHELRITDHPSVDDGVSLKVSVIIAALEPSEEDVSSLLVRIDATGSYSVKQIIKQLVKDNKITLSNIEEAYKNWEAADTED